jgi:hypothetical protein
MTDTTQPHEMSKADTALLIRAFWDSLLVPAWKKDDLITLGKLVFAKVPLREIEPELFTRLLLPHLNTIALSLGKRLINIPAPATPPAVAASPAPAALTTEKASTLTITGPPRPASNTTISPPTAEPNDNGQ